MEVLKSKLPGAKVLLLTILLSIVTAVVYYTTYSGTRYMAWKGLYIMAGGIVVALLLILARLARFAPGLLLVTNFVALLFHVYHIYFFISSVMTGIQYSSFPLDFFVVFILFGVTLVMSIACVFMPLEEER